MSPLAEGPTRLTRRRFLHLAALSAMTSLGVLDGCARLRPLEPTAERGAAATTTPERTLTVAALGDAGAFDPFNSSEATAPIVRNLYNSLVRLDPRRQATPELAEQWSMADEGRTLQIRLRPGVKFHSGRNVGADDLKANLERAQQWRRGLSVHDLVAGIKSIDVKDQYTAAVSFYEPSPMALDLMDLLAVGDPDAFDRYAERDGGTGPFVLVERVPSHHATLKRFPQYWESDRPRFDRIIARYFSDEQAIVAALSDGSVDVATSLTAAAARQVPVGVERTPVPRGLHVLVLHPGRAPFDRREVRQAVQAAIDRRALAAETLSGAVDPAASFFPSSSPAFDADLAGAVRFAPERARQLLGGNPVAQEKITLLVGQHEPDWEPIASALKGWLEPIGLSLETWPMPVGQWFAALNGGYFDAALASLDHTLRSPAAIAWNLPLRLMGNPLWPGGVPSAYADAVKTASTTIDEGRQRQAWRAMQQALINEAWVIPLAWHYRYAAFRRPLDGVAWTLAGQLLLNDAVLRP